MERSFWACTSADEIVSESQGEKVVRRVVCEISPMIWSTLCASSLPSTLCALPNCGAHLLGTLAKFLNHFIWSHISTIRQVYLSRDPLSSFVCTDDSSERACVRAKRRPKRRASHNERTNRLLPRNCVGYTHLLSFSLTRESAHYYRRLRSPLEK